MTSAEESQRDQSAGRFLRLVRGKRRGALKTYSGLAADVGKICWMLQETPQVKYLAWLFWLWERSWG